MSQDTEQKSGKATRAARQVMAKYPGVFLYETLAGERIFYLRCRIAGKQLEEKIGSVKEGWTWAKAAHYRVARIEGRTIKEKEQQEKPQEKIVWTLERLFGEYVQTLKKHEVGTCKPLFRYLQPLHQKEPKDITTLEVDAIRLTVEKAGKSPQTVKHVLSILRRTINYGVNKGLIDEPSKRKLRIVMPHVDNMKTEYMTDEQLVRYLAALDEESDQTTADLLRFALVTGVRRGAIFDLKWSDINFERGIITLRGESAKKKKTEMIPMNAAARNILQNLSTSTQSEYVFPGKDGQKRQFSRIPAKIRTKAGLPKDFRPLHGLRHHFASHLVSSGVEIYSVQKLLTHESPQMTQRYAHLADEAIRKAAAVADGIFTVKKPE